MSYLFLMTEHAACLCDVGNKHLAFSFSDAWTVIKRKGCQLTPHDLHHVCLMPSFFHLIYFIQA